MLKYLGCFVDYIGSSNVPIYQDSVECLATDMTIESKDVQVPAALTTTSSPEREPYENVLNMSTEPLRIIQHNDSASLQDNPYWHYVVWPLLHFRFTLR